ncbi:MAG TPA: DUF1800 domain-containing protein, partial [Flavisolibacter sp.]
AVQSGQLETTSPAALYQALKKESSRKPVFLDAADSYLKGLFRGIEEEGMRRKAADPDERKNIQKKNRESIRTLNLLWLDEMADSRAQLREKVAFFWHGHFAARNLNIFYQQGLLDTIRTHALGSFRDLLHSVSKSAAMLNFLNANQNRKDHPNENFAREVMELFTMGRGNYTELDIKEAARAFTGWGANMRGEFVFRKFQHDYGVKNVLGKRGNFEGEDVLDLLLEQKQTAHFITQKIYRFFVNENIMDQKQVNWLADRFYRSDYDIGKLMDDIFTSDWFYQERNIGSRIKSPVELITGMRRMLPMEIENKESLLVIQRLLGQILFYPPNVAGWPGGKSWIDSSSLMARMRLPMLLSDQDEMNIRPKADDDQMMGTEDAMRGGRQGRPIPADIRWKEYMKAYDDVKRPLIVQRIQENLLLASYSLPEAVFVKHADSADREAFIKSVTIRMMSTPEYQMC